MITSETTVAELLDRISKTYKINQLAVIEKELIPQIWEKYMRENNVKGMELLILKDCIMEEQYITEFFDYAVANNIDVDYSSCIARKIIRRYSAVYDCLMPLLFIDFEKHFSYTVGDVGSSGSAEQCRQLKIHILENFTSDYIDKFISAMPNRNKSLLKSNGSYYTKEDFWIDIPKEYKLGVII